MSHSALLVNTHEGGELQAQHEAVVHHLGCTLTAVNTQEGDVLQAHVELGVPQLHGC